MRDLIGGVRWKVDLEGESWWSVEEIGKRKEQWWEFVCCNIHIWIQCKSMKRPNYRRALKPCFSKNSKFSNRSEFNYPD